MNQSKNFMAVLQEALESPILSEVEKYGHCHLCKSYSNQKGNEIKISVLEFKARIYIIKYVDGECVRFEDITVGE